MEAQWPLAIALHQAVKEGRVDDVFRMVQASPHLVNCSNESGDTSLHIAVKVYSDAAVDNEPVHSDDECGDLEKRSDAKRTVQEKILAVLLEAKAHPNVCDRNGDTPLDILTKNAPLMLRVGKTNFRSATPAHLLFCNYGGKTSKNLQEERKNLLKKTRKRKRK
jgi:hypothetical protein